MARLTALPSLEIIRGFKGKIDFYLWKGLPCARAWPRYHPAKRTVASIAAAALFGQILKAYPLLSSAVLAFYQEDAKDQPRTARDLMVSGVLGHLHEVDMSDFLTLLQESRDFLSDLTALLTALDSVGTDELDVNVEHSVLPDSAATAAHQVTQNASLATIATLEEALESVDTDALQVRGRDQLFSLSGVLAKNRAGTIIGADGNSRSSTVPAGTYWLVTGIAARAIDSATTQHLYMLDHDAIECPLGESSAALAAGVDSYWQGFAWLDPGDHIEVYFIGAGAGEAAQVTVTGHVMTKEA